MKALMCLRDVVAQMYHPPVVVPNVGTFYRNIQDEVSRDPKSVIASHPGEFEVWLLGYYDDEQGIIDPDVRSKMCDLSELIVKAPE